MKAANLTTPDTILIIDFGSQFTQLIARRVREAGVYCEIARFDRASAALERLAPKGIILSGGPSSVFAADSPRADPALFGAGVPLLGVCYGEQAMVAELGGAVQPSSEREFGRAMLEVTAASPLFDGVWTPGEHHQVWMSHGDRIDAVPPGFLVIGRSDKAPFAAIADEARRLYGIQFHAEVAHTPDGARLIHNFVHRIAGCTGGWTMAGYRAAKVADVRAQVGDGRVICGLSGGVDSAVAALLIHEAVGAQLTCVFVDHGLLRQGEA